MLEVSDRKVRLLWQVPLVFVVFVLTIFSCVRMPSRAGSAPAGHHCDLPCHTGRRPWERRAGMSASVICFESFRSERGRRRSEEPEDGTIPVASAPFLSQPGVSLTAQQIAHRRVMLAYGHQRRRTIPAVFTTAATERE